jgi:hypothetical protein
MEGSLGVVGEANEANRCRRWLAGIRACKYGSRLLARPVVLRFVHSCRSIFLLSSSITRPAVGVIFARIPALTERRYTIVAPALVLRVRH